MNKLLFATLLVIMAPPILSLAGNLPEAKPSVEEKQVPPTQEVKAVNDSTQKEKDQISESKETDPRLPNEPWSHVFRESMHHDR